MAPILALFLPPNQFFFSGATERCSCSGYFFALAGCEVGFVVSLRCHALSSVWVC